METTELTQIVTAHQQAITRHEQWQAEHEAAMGQHNEAIAPIDERLERIAEQQETNQRAIAQLTAEHSLSRQDINTSKKRAFPCNVIADTFLSRAIAINGKAENWWIVGWVLGTL